MSKYTYAESVPPAKLEKMTKDASGVSKVYFAASKLGSLNPKQQTNYGSLNILLSNG